jgi:hypothetical protein
MRRRFGAGLSVILFVFSVSSLAAEDELLSLRNNPFSRPAVVKTPPPPPPPPVVIKAVPPPEEVILDLSATMVSATNPMVVVDGELLGIGDKIEGFELIAVLEGRAVFARGDREFSFAIDDEQLR